MRRLDILSLLSEIGTVILVQVDFDSLSAVQPWDFTWPGPWWLFYRLEFYGFRYLSRGLSYFCHIYSRAANTAGFRCPTNPRSYLTIYFQANWVYENGVCMVVIAFDITMNFPINSKNGSPRPSNLRISTWSPSYHIPLLNVPRTVVSKFFSWFLLPNSLPY